MVDDVDTRRLDAQVLLDLVGGELRHGDDGIAVSGGLAGLLSKARAEVGRGVTPDMTNRSWKVETVRAPVRRPAG